MYISFTSINEIENYIESNYNDNESYYIKAFIKILKDKNLDVNSKIFWDLSSFQYEGIIVEYRLELEISTKLLRVDYLYIIAKELDTDYNFYYTLNSENIYN